MPTRLRRWATSFAAAFLNLGRKTPWDAMGPTPAAASWLRAPERNTAAPEIHGESCWPKTRLQAVVLRVVDTGPGVKR